MAKVNQSKLGHVMFQKVTLYQNAQVNQDEKVFLYGVKKGSYFEELNDT